MYALTFYGTFATAFMLYQLMYATAWKKTEISLIPYINKDYYQMQSTRIDWNDPRAQRTRFVDRNSGKIAILLRPLIFQLPLSRIDV